MRLSTPHGHKEISTYIFIVPFGPKLVLITSWIPFAAEIFIAKAWAALANSAFGFNKLIAAISRSFKRPNFKRNKNSPHQSATSTTIIQRRHKTTGSMSGFCRSLCHLYHLLCNYICNQLDTSNVVKDGRESTQNTGSFENWDRCLHLLEFPLDHMTTFLTWKHART